MEGLAPPLKCLIEMQAALQNGEPVQKGVLRYLQSTSLNDAFALEVRRFLFAWEQGQDWRAIVSKIRSAQRRILLEIIANGLAGQPVLLHLEELKSEIAEACDSDLKRHLELLPITLLAPLLLLQFPAFLLLLFGPLVSRLLMELSKS
jgi:hypothetical protein